MGLSASQGRLLLLTAKRSDLEFRAQQITQRRLMLSQQLEEISMTYENATSNRQMQIHLVADSTSNKELTDTNNTVNLSYAALVSAAHTTGCLARVDGVNTPGDGYANATPIRLINSSGAIVVSDVSEIPTKFEYEADEKVTNGTYEFEDNDGSPKKGVYIEGLNISSNLSATITDAFDRKYDSGDPQIISYKSDEDSEWVSYVVEEGDDGKSRLTKVTDDYLKELSTNEDKKALFERLATKKEDGTIEQIKVPPGDSFDKLTSTKPTKTATLDRGELGDPGKDGVYEVELPDGTIQEYVVDPYLKTASTDGGTMDGPNYIQECIRNGKYTLEKWTQGTQPGEDSKWSSVSWDATTCISDRYYTEDDAAAKAKYDRLQNEIQQQDKKLELELDQIETQRSAVTTEIESVQKVINENIEKTFNPFNA